MNIKLIECSGKRLDNGELVYGAYIPNYSLDDPSEAGWIADREYGIHYPVDPKTVSNIITKEELKKIFENLADGGFLLSHPDRGTIIAERRAFHVANQFLGRKVELAVIDAFFKDAQENNREFGYVSALIKLKHADNKELNEVHDMAKMLLDVAGVDMPNKPVFAD